MNEVSELALPWVAESDLAYGEQPRIHDADGRLIAVVGNAETERQDQWEAHAALIVKRVNAANARAERMERALRSIAANTCCGSCMEAALVARAALTGEKVEEVAAIVPDHYSGVSLVFADGILHVRKDGSGHIVVKEEDFEIETEYDDDGSRSDFWITRFPPSEMQVLRDFLNGAHFDAAALTALEAERDEARERANAAIEDYNDALAALAAANARITSLEKALTPFADQAGSYDTFGLEFVPDEFEPSIGGHTIGDLRRARTALKEDS